jgi:hypothetical protein
MVGAGWGCESEDEGAAVVGTAMAFFMPANVGKSAGLSDY